MKSVKNGLHQKQWYISIFFVNGNDDILIVAYPIIIVDVEVINPIVKLIQSLAVRRLKLSSRLVKISSIDKIIIIKI